jgi:hypothetical protein
MGEPLLNRKGMIRILQIALIPVVCGILGLILLALSFLLPTGAIREHVEASVDQLYDEGVYTSVTPKLAGTQLDNFTEALYLNQALVSTKDAPLLDCVLEGYQFEPPAADEYQDPIVKLKRAAEEPASASLIPENKRFFNGYTVVMKILLELTHYSGIRQINLYLGLFLFLILLWGMLKRGLRRYILPTVVSLLLIHPVSMALNMASFGFFVCMLLPCIGMLWMKKETLEKRGWLLFGITGAATYYFNMNFIQLLSFGVPVLFYFLITGVPEKPLKLLGKLAELFIAWMVGLVGMMVFKWIVYAILKDPKVFSEMLDQFLVRSGLSEGSRTDAILHNVTIAFENRWWNLLEILFIAGTVLQKIRKKEKFAFSVSGALLLLIMILLPVGRYFILSNHVLIHGWTTYRLLLIPVLAFNLRLIRGNASEISDEREVTK